MGTLELSRSHPGGTRTGLGDYVLPLLLGLTAAVTAFAAANAPLAACAVLGGLLSLGLWRLILKRAWGLLCWVVIPAIGLGQFRRIEMGSTTLIAPALLVVAIWAGGFFIVLLFSKEQPIRRLPLFWPFAFFEIAVLLSVVNSVSVLHWARGMLESVAGFAFFAYPFLYLKNRYQLATLLRVFTWVAVLTVAYGLFQFVAYDSLKGLFPIIYAKPELDWLQSWHDQSRLVGNWIHPSDFGSLINIIAPITLFTCLRTRKIQALPLCIFLLVAAAVFLTGVRTTIVAFCVSSILLCFLMRGRKAGFWVLGGAVILLVLGSTLFSVATQRFQVSDTRNAFTIEERFLMWTETIGLFLEHPVVGVGARNIPDLTELSPGLSTHNAYIETAAETGTIGLLAFLYLLYRLMRVDFNISKDNLPLEMKHLRYAFLCSSLAIMLESLTDNDFFVWQVWCLFLLMRGLSTAIAARPNLFAENHLSESC